jgi:hypothetical protein
MSNTHTHGARIVVAVAFLGHGLVMPQGLDDSASAGGNQHARTSQFVVRRSCSFALGNRTAAAATRGTMIGTVPMNLAYPTRNVNLVPIKEQRDLDTRDVLAVVLSLSSLLYTSYSVVASFRRSSRFAPCSRIIVAATAAAICPIWRCHSSLCALIPSYVTTMLAPGPRQR